MTKCKYCPEIYRRKIATKEAICVVCAREYYNIDHEAFAGVNLQRSGVTVFFNKKHHE